MTVTDGVRAAAAWFAMHQADADYALDDDEAPYKLRAAVGDRIGWDAAQEDCNPGTSPLASLLLMLNMACTLFRLTPAEALNGVTHAAARALGMQDEIGSLEVGKRADLAFWQVDDLAELCYSYGTHTPVRVLRGASSA
ncbi:amidohydrolase family protein [Bordetella hinzii]|jgi:imidazolonepropionase|uniref:imidazolonepropionase n=1 Tax=Bordetella hinzii TaxID=103855 RepID=A0AAN1RUN5_9BORD|nr:Imidazolonepropionase [Bordetella hinzii]KCB43272.1 putative imidazolonepropionase [Bordetella hinzii 4161]KXA72464.1 hypothetical protein AXA74_13540 [Bordetella hinzii LMG 13501]AZW16411.1 hypothetical protein CS347_06370 [Bordetella hinzii]MBZ0074311.1 amidohydrolase family protein [Bordetella hinzii]